MPQLDIYSYFTQFHWFLLIFTLLFLFVNGNYIKTFHSLLFSRYFLLNQLTSPLSKSSLTSFPFVPNYKTGIKLVRERDSISLNPNSTFVKNWDNKFESIRIKKNVKSGANS